jgi:hypothetical protein
MKPFRSAEEMLDAHELMFGMPGRQCAEIVLRWAGILFAAPLDTLNIRVVLAPVELGPYNRHLGYHYGGGDGAFILGNRHIVTLRKGELVFVEDGEKYIGWFEDFIVHELTHARQHQLEREHDGEPGWQRTRGDHRNFGWYAAVAEACPRYLGVELPRSSWPRGPRTRDTTLTEVEMTHWPGSLRRLAKENDPRLPKLKAPTRTETHVHAPALS